MPKPLSEDLRQRVINYCNEGLIQRKIAEMLKVSTSFVSRLIKRYKIDTINIIRNPNIPQKSESYL
jgi:transposase